MENKNLNKEEILNKDKSIFKEEKDLENSNDFNSNQNLTNERKLEYLSKLIQDVDHNLELNGISKKMIR